MQRLALVAVLGIAVAQPGTSQPAQTSHNTRFITSDLSATDEWPCFSPDGQTLVTSNWAGEVQLWNVARGERVLPLRGHTGLVWGLAFSPDACDRRQR